jgi:monoamine oxidase
MRRLAMGHVRRVVVLLDGAPHEVLPRAAAEPLRDGGFLQGEMGPLPVWWTVAPPEAPLLVGWAGGPAAERSRETDVGALVERALEALAERLGAPRDRLAARVAAWWSHDWTADPFARGAYSYPLVGGADAGAALAEPVEGTLFFAGEACAPEGENGTVDGAIESGRAAARAVLDALA